MSMKDKLHTGELYLPDIEIGEGCYIEPPSGPTGADTTSISEAMFTQIST